MKDWLLIALIGLAIRIFISLYVAQSENCYEGNLSTHVSTIDYKIYLDSSLYDSPYERHTYRYSPLLSIMMSPSYKYFHAFGKVLFSIFDFIATYFAYHIFYKPNDKKRIYFSRAIATAYSLNPIFIYLTVRGSNESITMALMYAFWYYYTDNINISAAERAHKSLSQRQPNVTKRYISYIIFGIFVHIRVFPIILVPLLIMYQYHSCKENKFNHALKFTIEFGLVSGGVFLALAAYFYYLYGYDFLHETYFYHLTRRDNRHSLSVYFLEIYLNYDEDTLVGSASRSIARIIPFILVLLVTSFKFIKYYSLAVCQTILICYFVSFNKVITCQYFIWLFGSIFLGIPEDQLIFKNKNYWKFILLHLITVTPVLIHLILQFKIKHNSQNSLYHVWYASLFLMLSHVLTVRYLISQIQPYSVQGQLRKRLEIAKEQLSNKKD